MEDKALLNHLLGFVSENKKALFEKNIFERTNYITIALEDIFQPQNASAVLRTCDCLGIQNIHIIENRNKYRINKDVVKGATKWIDVHKHNTEKNNSLDCIHQLKKEGYRIIATMPHKDDCLLEDFDLNKGKAAIFLGTEKGGLSDTIIQNADEFLKIPIYGFTESYNISVSAGIILHHLTYLLRNSNIDWQLSDLDKNNTLLNWARAAVSRSDVIERAFLAKTKKKS